MKIYQVRSVFPCLVKWQGGEDFLQEGMALEFEELQRLFVYPATGRREDTAFVLDLNSPCRRARVIEVEDTKIFYLEKNREDEIVVEEKTCVLGKDINIKIGTHSAHITCDNVTKTIEIERPKKYEILTVESFVILKITSAFSQQAVLFNAETLQTDILSADKIDIVDKEILLLDGGHEEKYVIDGAEFSCLRSYDFTPRNSEVCGMMFLQNIKSGKLAQACKYVSALLLPTPEKLKAYFGEIIDFFPFDKNKYVIIKKSGHDVVQLDLKENLICNIEILN